MAWKSILIYQIELERPARRTRSLSWSGWPTKSWPIDCSECYIWYPEPFAFQKHSVFVLEVSKSDILRHINIFDKYLILKIRGATYISYVVFSTMRCSTDIHRDWRSNPSNPSTVLYMPLTHHSWKVEAVLINDKCSTQLSSLICRVSRHLYSPRPVGWHCCKGFNPKHRGQCSFKVLRFGTYKTC